MVVDTKKSYFASTPCVIGTETAIAWSARETIIGEVIVPIDIGTSRLNGCALL
jgi:hypothetical protein